MAAAGPGRAARLYTLSKPWLSSPAPSSPAIVPTPWSSKIVPPTALERFTKNVSAGSATSSPLTMTVMGCVVVPAGKRRLPEVAT
jgi:hypothetical protein